MHAQNHRTAACCHVMKIDAIGGNAFVRERYGALAAGARPVSCTVDLFPPEDWARTVPAGIVAALIATPATVIAPRRVTLFD